MFSSEAQIGDEELVGRDEQDGADHRAGDRAAAAQDRHQHELGADQDAEEDGRAQEGQVVAPERAGHADEQAAQRERQDLVEPGRDAGDLGLVSSCEIARRPRPNFERRMRKDRKTAPTAISSMP